MSSVSNYPNHRRPNKRQRDDPETAFKRALTTVAADTEALLKRLQSADPAPGEPARPQRLIEAMRYASLGGGKRIRPFLVVETARLFGAPRRHALMVGAALECVHCYSLVHDDLPAMDDDSLRRGRPTVHKAFDEATGILAGDALLTFAFDILSRPQSHPNPATRIALVSALARAAGVGGMAGGQMIDLSAEGRFADADNAELDFEGVRTLQSMKTGALLKFACMCGGILGNADRKSRAALERYGASVGEAFQIADDLLDVDGDATIIGKATGKDAAAHKATFVSLIGVEGARDRLKRLITEADNAIAMFGDVGAVLRTAAHFIAYRRS